LTLIGLVVLILIVGFCVWLVRFLPVDETFKRIAIGIVIFVTVLYIISAIFPGALPFGHMRLK